MNLSLHYEYFISVLSAVVALVLFFVHREKTMSPRILALYFLCGSYMVFYYALIRYGDVIHFPHLWRSGVFMGMLNPVLAFIYVRSVLEQRSGLQRSDMLLLSLPVILALTFSGFFIQPATVKLSVIRETLGNRALYVEEREGILPPGASMLFRLVFGNALVIWQLIILFRWHRRTRTRLPDSHQNLSIFRWLVFFTAATGSAYLLTTLQFLFQIFQEQDYYWVSTSVVMLAALSAMTYLFLKPNILYGLRGWVKDEPMDGSMRETVPKQKQSSRKEPFPAVQAEKIQSKVEAFLLEHKPFLRQGYTIANLSVDTGIPLYQLSAFINQQYGQSFKEFINGHRVQYIKDVLLKEPDADQYTLEAIGKKAGFNSRGTLIAAVKKKTGQTPSSFLLGKE